MAPHSAGAPSEVACDATFAVHLVSPAFLSTTRHTTLFVTLLSSARASPTRRLVALRGLRRRGDCRVAASRAGARPIRRHGRRGMPNVPQSMFGKRKPIATRRSRPSLSATDEPVAEIRIVGNKTIPTDADSQPAADPRRPAVRSRPRPARRPQALLAQLVPRRAAVVRPDRRRPRRDLQSRRAARHSLRQLPRQRRHPRQKAGQGNRAEGRRLGRSVRRRGGPPQDHRSLPSQRLQQRPGH